MFRIAWCSMRPACSAFTLVLMLAVPSLAGAATIDATIYFDHAITSATSELRRVSPDGSGMETLLTTDRINTLVVDPVAELLYWTGGNAIHQSALDGSEPRVLLEANGPRGIAIDSSGGKMYWAEGRAGPLKIRRANLDGSNAEDLLTWPAFSVSLSEVELDTAADRMYWIDTFGRISRSRLDGSDAEEDFFTPGGITGGLALDSAAGHMYWVESLGHVYRADLDGTGQVELATLLGGQFTIGLRDLSLDLANGKVYWSIQNLGMIQRANLDGSGIEDVIPRGVLGDPITGNAHIGSIALFIPPVPEPSALSMMAILASALFLYRQSAWPAAPDVCLPVGEPHG